MALENAEVEGDLYYVSEDGFAVMKRPVIQYNEAGVETGSTLGFLVCTADEFVDGAAEEIARCLNRLPKAEAVLIHVAGSIRAGAAPQALADEIEEFIVG